MPFPVNSCPAQRFALFCLLALIACVPAVAADTKGDKKADDAVPDSVTTIDIAKQPWLVETARIPEGMPNTPKPRMLWANSVQGQTIQEILNGPIEVEHWINGEPKDLAGKFILVEVWATWCPPCRRSLALLEFFHEKYKDKLVVVSICETDEAALKKMPGPVKLENIKAPLAVDTHRRFANTLGVYGIPHAVLIDPILGAVVWEGMPTQIGYELSDERIGKILANLDRPAVKERLPKVSPVQFKACPPDPNKPNKKPETPVRCAGEEGTPCGQEEQE